MFNHRHKSALVAVVFVAGIAGAVAPTMADTAPAQTPAKPSAGNNALDRRLMVSNDGFRAERDIQGARIAIFQGNPDGAKALVKDAQAELSTVATQAPTYTSNAPRGAEPHTTADMGRPAAKGADIKGADAKGAEVKGADAKGADAKMAGTNPDLIPIDGQMVVADDMALTPDKAAKVQDANEHLKKGETDMAMDTLKQGAIDVAFTRVLMPVRETAVHVTAAGTLLDSGKYYEANLALKAAQDLLRTDTVSFDDTAAQASKMTGVPAETASAVKPAQTPAKN